MMTGTQRKIYEAIQSYVKAKGYPPSIREIGRMVGLSSTSTVHDHLVRMKRRGYVDYEPGRPRTLRVVKEHDETVPVSNSG